jgi:hypothetical protein
VRKVADKLAEFVAKNGRSFEEVTRQRNPADGPFRCAPLRVSCASLVLWLLLQG